MVNLDTSSNLNILNQPSKTVNDASERQESKCCNKEKFAESLDEAFQSLSSQKKN
ncbi:MAG: hypothetical protein WA981_15465 [Glaciecola sp.]|jgi:hypothetical protein